MPNVIRTDKFAPGDRIQLDEGFVRQHLAEHLLPHVNREFIVVAYENVRPDEYDLVGHTQHIMINVDLGSGKVYSGAWFKRIETNA